jgi:hypothetical protein
MHVVKSTTSCFSVECCLAATWIKMSTWIKLSETIWMKLFKYLNLLHVTCIACCVIFPSSPFGCRHSTLEFRIDIGQLEYRCLDVWESRIGNGVQYQLSIRCTCALLPPIRSLFPPNCRESGWRSLLLCTNSIPCFVHPNRNWVWMALVIPKANFMAIQTMVFIGNPFQYQAWFGILSNSIPSLPIPTSKQSIGKLPNINSKVTPCRDVLHQVDE